MLSLTRIYLHNWHRFHDHLIDVKDSLYLAGHNGSGKSSVLDALQLVLIGDLSRIRFNSSAQERFSARSLDTYVRGKIGESRFLRPGGAVAYIALEFTNSQSRDCLTFGACVESAEGRTSERLYFSLPGSLDPAQFVVDGRPLPRRELRQALRGQRGARAFDQVGEYQTDLLNRLGGLNERFFDLFIKALRFEPIRNIRDFVEQWVLPSRPLELETLQRVVERLKSLSTTVERLKGQLAHLQRVVDQQAEVSRLRGLHEQWLLVKALLEAAAAQRALLDVRQQLDTLREQIREGEAQHAQTQAALAGAQEALREAERQLYQSDVVRRRDELRQRIAAQTREADAIRRRWDDLRCALRNEQESLQPLASDDALPADEQAALRALLVALASLQPGAPPPSELPAQIEAIIPLLQGAADRTREARFELTRQIRELKTRGDTLEADLARLKRDGRIAYRPEVERLRDLLAPIVNERPKLLCELLEVPAERWQDAVEAMLGPRRFNIIVRPTAFDQAVQVLDRARAHERLYDVGLLDVARALNDARPAQPGSLAAQVATNNAALRAYVDQVLGEIITCATVSELRRYRRSVTPEVVVYGEWTVRAVQPERFRPWFVGSRAQRSQIENLERQRDQVAGDLQALVPKEAALAARLQRLERWAVLNSTLPRFEQPLDERPPRADMEDAQRELDALDLSGVNALEAEVTRLQGIVAQEQSRETELAERLARWDERRSVLETQAQTAERALAERESDAANLCQQYPASVAEAEHLRDQRLAQPDLSDAISNADRTMKTMLTQTDNARGALIEEAARYNTEYTFGARADDPGEERYAQEAERLRATELPSYSEDITEAQTEAEDELREHVLHKLREQVRNARVELDRLNEALAGRDFRGKHYRFRVEPNDSLREFYDLILGTELLGSNSLFESQFYRDHKAAFDRFYEALVRVPQSDAERGEQAKLTDYRRYLVYDIEVTLPDGQVSRLSRTMDQMSGGEVQTPFYLAIAASFVQLYRINERTARPTIRLVAFDEAFSKMDQDHIGSTLDLFQHFNLQVMTATPLERCEYLVPKMCTSLVLTAVADTVHIEPYVNYQARLSELYED